MLLSGAWWKVIHEKNQKQKISWHCPLKKQSIVFLYVYCVKRKDYNICVLLLYLVVFAKVRHII